MNIETVLLVAITSLFLLNSFHQKKIPSLEKNFLRKKSKLTIDAMKLKTKRWCGKKDSILLRQKQMQGKRFYKKSVKKIPF